jgi:lipid-A-disaccharide synthase-like uncharacterized protein
MFAIQLMNFCKTILSPRSQNWDGDQSPESLPKIIKLKLRTSLKSHQMLEIWDWSPIAWVLIGWNGDWFLFGLRSQFYDVGSVFLYDISRFGLTTTSSVYLHASLDSPRWQWYVDGKSMETWCRKNLYLCLVFPFIWSQYYKTESENQPQSPASDWLNGILGSSSANHMLEIWDWCPISV